MLWLHVFVTALGWLYTCISKRRFWAILHVKHLWYLVQSALKMKSKLNFIVINETAKKWTAKVCFHVWSYGNFCLPDLCLHNQIVQDGISSSLNKCERWKCLHENGTKKMYKPTSVTKIFLKFEMLWVKTFQIAKVNTDKTSLTCITPKTIHCLICSSRSRQDTTFLKCMS